jgi:hypothetical protein
MTNASKPWLEKKYQEKKARTLSLVERAILHLQKEDAAVSLTSIVTASKIVDNEGRGVSSSAILNNEQARQAYERARQWRGRKAAPIRKRPVPNPLALHIKIDRRRDDVVRRLKKLTKHELIDRLLVVEEAYAALQQKWLEDQTGVLYALVNNKEPNPA